MAPDDNAAYSDTARALASRIDDDHDAADPLSHSRRSGSHSPAWRRRSLSHRPDDARPATTTTTAKWLQRSAHLRRQTLRMYARFTPLQRIGIAVGSLALLALVVVGLAYNERIFAALAPAAQRWRALPAGWLILWALTFAVSFPPLIGYSTCVTLAGFVFGMPGWLIVSSASVLGSTAAFAAARSALRACVGRWTKGRGEDARFAALALVLKHDGLPLLVMIRLCPLPYSLSNGALSTIPTVTWPQFMLATALASPKLLLHVFVGSRLRDLAENGAKMDARTKAVSYASIAFGVGAGAATGYFIYVRTQARARQLEAQEEEEAAASGGARRASDPANAYNDDDGDDDDDDEDPAAVRARRPDDAISLHQTYEHDLEGGYGYRDEFADGGLAEPNVFDLGDGDEAEAKKDGR